MVASFIAVLGLTAALAAQDGVQPGGGEAGKIAIKPDSALGKLVREVEAHEATRVIAAERAVAAATKRARTRADIPDWLRAHYLRNHPETRALRAVGPPDPTGGLPLALESLYIWMLQHQELQPPAAPANPLRAAAAAIEAGADLRISGRNENPNSESDIRINPGDPRQIIAGSNNISGSRQAQFFSADGGATWGQTLLPLLSNDSLHSDPTVDWASDGTAWATTIGIAAGSTTLQMRAYRSTDGGKTWTFDSTFSGDQTSTDKQMVWIDRSSASPFRDTIHAIWHNNQPVFVNRRTSDGWQVPQQVSGPETTGTGIGGDITTNAKGEVFAVWPDTGTRNIYLAKSVNGGESFDKPSQVTRTFAAFDIGVPAFDERRILVYASIAAFRSDARDDVYVSWTDLSGESQCGDRSSEPGNDVNSPCKSRVWFRRSVDGGLHWEPAQKINDSTDRNDQFNQKLVVDPKTGNLGIIYYQTGTGSDRKKTNIFFQASIDNGGTWSKPATRVTTATTDETTATADLNQYGDYNGLSVADGVFFPCWTDRRDNKVESIFTARIRLKTNAAGAVEPELAAGPAPAVGGSR